MKGDDRDESFRKQRQLRDGSEKKEEGRVNVGEGVLKGEERERFLRKRGNGRLVRGQ